MTKKQITTKNAPAPAGPYSQGIIDGNYIFIAGQRPVDPATGEKKEGITEQTRQVIQNIKNILEEAGCSLEDIVRTTVYLSDISYFDKMNEVYSEMMPQPFPARTTIGAQLRGILVEIDVIASRRK